jgi:hypothetical protein
MPGRDLSSVKPANVDALDAEIFDLECAIKIERRILAATKSKLTLYEVGLFELEITKMENTLMQKRIQRLKY